MEAAVAECYVGEIRLLPYTLIPAGWSICDGSLLSINQHPALYSLIGTKFGGNGTTNFALPDLRGRTILGAGAPANGGAPLPVGATGGTETVQLSVSQMPGHTHSVMVTDAGGTTMNAQGMVVATPTGASSMPSPPSQFVPATSPDTVLAVATVGTAGGGLAHENRQPFLVLVPCIAVNGVYPHRP